MFVERERLTVTEWSDKYRQLSPESCPTPGPWHTSRVPYLAEIMDAFLSGKRVVFMKSSQVGATEALNNCLGYVISHDPGPTMVIQPTIEMAKAWSKDRLEPMLRDTPILRGLVTDRSKDSDNTILHKKFPEGHLTCVGANSAVSLRSRPIRNLLADEVDIYPASAGTSGDPLSLGIKRTKAFPNRRVFIASTPTIKGRSRIEALFQESDMQYCFVPCPHCGHYQHLVWRQLRWLRELEDGERVPASDPKYSGRGRHLPDTAVYVCEECGAEIEHADKVGMLARRQWRATASAKTPDVVGFHINELYSPTVSWAEMASSWLEARKLPETLKGFVNEALGETWEEESEKHEPGVLRARAEPYEAPPSDVLFATWGCDVQLDRLEVEAIGWGYLFESWSLEWFQLVGDTSMPEVWQQLHDWLIGKQWEREDGRLLRPTCGCVDSGFQTDMAYRFTLAHKKQQVYATKGRGGISSAEPVVGRVSRNNKLKCPVIPVNVDQAKDRIFGWLDIATPGPGYMHFPAHYDAEYYEQLTAERRIERVRAGRRIRAYEQMRKRNEALDLRVLNLVAVELLRPNWQTLREQLGEAPEEVGGEVTRKTPQPRKARPKRRKYSARQW